MSSYGGKIGVFKPYFGYRLVNFTTLTAITDQISLTNLPNKAFYLIQANLLGVGGTGVLNSIRLNNDSGANYAHRRSVDGAADVAVAAVNQASINSAVTLNPCFIWGWIGNIPAQEKMGTIHLVTRNTAGAANVPDRIEFAFKWANAVDAINEIDIFNNGGTGDYAIGSEVAIYASDSP